MTSIVFGTGRHRRLTILDRVFDRPFVVLMTGAISALAIEAGLLYGWWLAQ